MTPLPPARRPQGDAAEAAALAQDALTAQAGKIKQNTAAMALTYAVLAQGLAGEGKLHEALDAAREADSIFGTLPTLSAISRQIQIANKAELTQLSTIRTR